MVDLETSKVSSKKSSSITRKSSKSLITTKFDKKKKAAKQPEQLPTEPFSSGPTQRFDMSELGIVLES